MYCILLSKRTMISSRTLTPRSNPSLCADEDFLRFIKVTAPLSCWSMIHPLRMRNTMEMRNGACCWPWTLCIVNYQGPKVEILERKRIIMQNMYEVDRLSTTRALVLVLKKHTECHCLDELAARAKEMESTRHRDFCLKEMSRNEIWHCNGCKVMSQTCRLCPVENAPSLQTS